MDIACDSGLLGSLGLDKHKELNNCATRRKTCFHHAQTIEALGAKQIKQSLITIENSFFSKTRKYFRHYQACKTLKLPKPPMIALKFNGNNINHCENRIMLTHRDRVRIRIAHVIPPMNSNSKYIS